MIITTFQVEDKVKRSHYLKKIVLLTDNNINIALDIPFSILSNAENNFAD